MTENNPPLKVYLLKFVNAMVFLFWVGIGIEKSSINMA